MGGLVRSMDGVAIAIGGVTDHVHLLVRWRPDEKLAELLRVVKSRSSRWVHDTFPALRDFRWQEAYAAFTVSKSQSKDVGNYIYAQAEHHRTVTFEEELRRFLTKHGIAFDDRYLLG
jgi:putative transposase